MTKLLHIVASPRQEDSRSLKISKEFLKSFQETHPKCEIDELVLAETELPPIAVKNAGGKYLLLQGKDPASVLNKQWQSILKHINRFTSADIYLITTPMWNFNIPYQLKHYIDIIVQPSYLFRFTEKGPEGLLKNKKMIVITSRGGDYTGALKPLDFQEPYLRTIFGFCGITDIQFIIAQPVDMGPEIGNEKILKAQEEARKLARKI